MSDNIKPKIVFLGTPQFAVPSLQKLIEAGYEIPFVITQPDKPSGRGQQIVECPVKKLALQNGIEVRQPVKIREDRSLIEELNRLQPDLMVTSAFGQIISQEIIDIPKWGIWNVHASLLPRWRGAAPINWAILAGDTETGITIMQTEKGLDTGPMLLKKQIPILPEDTSETLTEKLSCLGADLLIDAIQKQLQESIHGVAQDDSLVTMASKLSKETGLINCLEETVTQIERKVRALLPWPTAWLKLSNAEVLKVFQVGFLNLSSENKSPGAIFAASKNEIALVCKDGLLQLITVQPPNKPKMKAADWFRGLKTDSIKCL